MLNIKRSIPASREEVFRLWSEPKLLEKWAYPEEMRLKVPHFETNEGGTFRFEYYHGESITIYHGIFEEFVPHEKLVQLELMRGSNRHKIYPQLRTEINFHDETRGTLVSILQSGFSDRESVNKAAQSWFEMLDHLIELIARQRFRPGQELRAQQVKGRSS